jgi:hypothetical protein
MAETWFDTRTGELLVGSAAIEERLPESSPGEIVTLGQLLTVSEFPFGYGDFKKPPSASWSREDMISLGHWALGLINASSEDYTTLSREHMDRLYLLGLGPAMRRQHHFKTMGELRASLGESRGRDYGRYDDWTLHEFVQYAAELCTQLGWKPRKQDYDATDGPGVSIIRSRIGGISILNEMIGYPNFRLWSDEEYVGWGVRVLRAQDNKEISRSVIDALSVTDHGPSKTTIRKHFGSWLNYKRLVLQEHYRQEAHENALFDKKMTAYTQMLENGELPSYLRLASAEELLELGGRYVLAKNILNKKHGNVDALMIATNFRLPIIKQLKQYAPLLSTAEIETLAMSLNVYDDIWPVTGLDEILKVA